MRTPADTSAAASVANTDEAVLSVLRELTRVTDLSTFPAAVLRALRTVIPYDVGSYNEVDPAGDRFVAVTEPADFCYPPDVVERFIECLDEHPLVRAQAMGNGAALRISDCIDRQTYRATSLYRDVYQPLGVEFQMSIALPAPRPLVVAFALCRQQHDFRDLERARLEAIRPHLAHTFHLLRRIDRLSRLAPMDRRDSRRGLVSVAPDGQLAAVDDAWLRFPRWFAPGNILVDELAHWARAHVSSTGLGLNSTRLPFMVRGVDGTLTARLVSTAIDGTTTLLVEEQYADTQRLIAMGLTPREADIVAKLIEGVEPADIAIELGSRKATIDKHLEHVYRKLGVTRRAEAVAAALDALADVDDQ